MSLTLHRMVLSMYLVRLAAVTAAVLVVYLVGDFADRLNAYLAHPARHVAELYGLKAVVGLGQLVPAAMLLAASATASTLRQRGEWNAMMALGLSRWTVVAPVLAVSLVAAGGLTAFDELVVSRAGRAMDTMMVERFGRWGDYRFFYVPQHWFRVGERLVYVRGPLPAEVMTDVTVLTLDAAFGLEERVDAATMRHAGADTWRLEGVIHRRFAGRGELSQRRAEEEVVRLPGSSASTFEVHPGRPEYEPVARLLEQEQRRRAVGLPVDRLVLARHNRFAYPLTGVAATVLAVLIALRAGRRGHLTVALVEGLGVVSALFALLVIGRALAMGAHLPAVVAAWAPVVGLALLSAALWRAAEPSPRVTATARTPADRPARPG